MQKTADEKQQVSTRGDHQMEICEEQKQLMKTYEKQQEGMKLKFKQLQITTFEKSTRRSVACSV